MFFRLKCVLVRVAQIDCKDGFFRNDVNGIRLKGDRADRRDCPAAGKQTPFP